MKMKVLFNTHNRAFQNFGGGEIVLLKTSNSDDESFNFEFIYLEESGAEYLKNLNVKAVGIDALGIERSQSNHSTHKVLLSEKIPIIEGLRLQDVEEGKYKFVGFPIKIKEVEASLLRAVLIKE